MKNSTKLQNAASNGDLHETTASEYAVSGLSRKDLLWLYDAQLTRKTGPGREIYNKIMVTADLCAYCHHGVAATLDHFVPKTTVPGLSIDPWNLVPACARCNHELLDNFSSLPTEQMLHPYFTPSIGRWLTASIDHVDPVTVRFAATPEVDLAPELQARIRNQFSRLRLGQLYSIVCASELVGLSRLLSSQFRHADASEVSAYLSELALPGFETDQNDRRAVMFETLAGDEWYCAGGYSPRSSVVL